MKVNAFAKPCVLLTTCLIILATFAFADYGTFSITEYSPKQGSINGGTVITFRGAINETISDDKLLSVLFNNSIYCDIKDNYLSTLTAVNVISTLFSCVTRPAFSRADRFPQAALLANSSWISNCSVGVAFNGHPVTFNLSSDNSFVYNRSLTPILTSMRVLNVNMSIDTGVVGPTYLPISLDYLHNPVVVEIRGYFVCNAVSCLKNVYFNDPSLECLLRNPDDNVPYGFTPSPGYGTPAVALCVFYTMIPGAFMPLVNVDAMGYSIVTDPSLYKVNQYGNVSMISFVPTINSIEPYSASLRGGETIHIAGAGFSLDVLYPFNGTAYQVTIGKIPCLVTTANESDILCVLQGGWEQQEQPNNDSWVHPKGLSVQWYSAVNVSAINVLDSQLNSRYPSLPDRWYVTPSTEAPINQSSIVAKKAFANQWDNYGRVLCGDFLPPVNGNYYFSFVCTGTCNVYFKETLSSANYTRIAWDNSDPNLAFSFWKPTQATTGVIPLLTNTTYRFKIDHVGGQGYDFVGMQVRYPNGSAYPVPTELWRACYQEDWPTPLTKRKAYYGYRGIKVQSLGNYYSKEAGGLGKIYLTLESGPAVPSYPSTSYTGYFELPSTPGATDAEVLGYYTPYQSSWYQFSIMMDIPDSVLAPESELYLIQDDFSNNVAPHAVLLAHTFQRSYLGPAQTSPSVYLQAGHPYLLQYYTSARNFSVNVSVTDVGQTTPIVYNPITSDSIMTAVYYPAVVVQFYGNTAVCNYSTPMNGYPCEFQFAPVVSALEIPAVLVAGSVVNMTLDTWSITNVVGTEIVYVDDAICPIVTVDNATRVVSCVVSEDRYGGVVNMRNITFGPWGVLDVQDISPIDSIAPFNLSSSYVYQYYFPEQSYSPSFFIRIVFLGFGFDTTPSQAAGHTMTAKLDGYSCSLEGLAYNSLTVLCPAHTMAVNYTALVELSHSSVTIANSTVVVGNPTDAYRALMNSYSYELANATATEIANETSFYSSIQVNGGSFSDLNTTANPFPAWWNEGLVSADGGATFQSCANTFSSTIHQVTLNCSIQLIKLNSTVVKVRTHVNGTVENPSSTVYEGAVALSYDWLEVDRAFVNVYPPALTSATFKNFDFTGSANMSSFSVDVYIAGTNFGQQGATIDFSLLPTYYQSVGVNQSYNVAPGSTPYRNVATTNSSCGVTALYGNSLLVCSLMVQLKGNDTFTFSIDFVSNGSVSLVTPFPSINYTLSFETLDAEYNAWLLAHSSSGSSSSVVAIVVPVVVGCAALAVVGGAFGYMKYRNAKERRRKALIAAQEEIAEAEAAAALEREELGGLTHRKPTGQVFVNF